MNINQLLNSFLSAGQSVATQGKDFAEQKMGVPESGNERNAMLSGMGKGALAAGALGLLLGSKKGRKFATGALKVGSVAALGGLAYTAYNQWKVGQSNQATMPQSDPAALQNQAAFSLTATEQEAHDKKLLQALIAAAKADGHIDDDERVAIEQQMEKMGNNSEVNLFIQEELNKPLNPAEVAAGINTPELASEVYMITRMLVDETSFMERAYLQELSQHLKLDPNLIRQLDAQIGV